MDRRAWRAAILSPKGLALIDKLVSRRFSDEAEALEAGLFIIESLAADDWARCTKFRGKCDPRSYLYTLCDHAAAAFQRHKYGRPRAPSWVVRKGDGWKRLWFLIWVSRLPEQTINERLVPHFFRDTDELHQAMAAIRADNTMGHGQNSQLHIRTPEQPDDLPGAGNPEKEAAQAEEQARLKEMLLALPEADGSLLREHFLMGQSYVEIGERQHVPAYQACRKAQAALKKLRVAWSSVTPEPV